jgi:uncharacterized membrane protein
MMKILEEVMSKDSMGTGLKKKFYVWLVLGVALMIGPATAHAKISDWFQNVGQETVIIVNIIVLILGAVGVILTGIGVVGAIFAKKNKQPMEHQPWFIVGGVLCILLVPMVMALGDSIADDEAGDSTAESFLDGGNSDFID